MNRVSWPWTVTEDREQASMILHELGRSAADGQTHEDAVTGPPWPTWMARLCRELELYGLSTAVVTAVGLCARDNGRSLELWARALGILDASLPVGRALAAHDAVILAAKLEGALEPGNPPLRLRQGQVDIDPVPCPPSRLSALVWGVAGGMRFADVRGWVEFGKSVAPLISFVDTSRMLWIERNSGSLRISPLLLSLMNDPAISRELVFSYAGMGASDQARNLRRIMLATDGVHETVREVWSRHVQVAMSCKAAEEPVARNFLRSLAQHFDELWNHGSGIFSLLHSPSRSPGPVLQEHRNSINRGIAFLRQESPWTESWDRQIMEGEAVTGTWFVRAQILQCLAVAGQQVESDIKALFDEIPHGELRYFDNCSSIPRDSDSLGLLLALSNQLSVAPHDKIQSWIAWLDESLADDLLAPTWLMGSDEEPAWRGNACADVRLRLVGGLACHGSTTHEPVIRANLVTALRQYSEGRFGGSEYYCEDFARLLFAEAFQACRGLIQEHGLVDEMGGVREQMVEDIVSSQRLDGGWGEPQRTAINLEAYLRLVDKPDWPVAWRGCQYLLSRQNTIGSWHAEPLYLTLGKYNSMTFHRGTSLTTAFCCRALAVSLRMLESRRAEM